MHNRSILLAGNFSNDTGYAWSNIYKLFNDIATELSKDGIQPCLSFGTIRHPVTVINSKLNCPITKFDPFNITLISVFRFLRFIRSNHVKYIYLTDYPCTHWLYPLFRLTGIQKIIIHNRTSAGSPKEAEWDNSFKARIKQLSNATPFFSADKIFAVSDFVRNRLIKKNRFPEARIIKILNGIDLNQFHPKNQNNSKTTSINIFCAGRASIHKGINTLIEATAIVKKHLQVELIVQYAGDGPDLDNLKALVHSLALEKNFIFLGQLASTEHTVMQADIVVVPSLWGDACPSSVSEAMASGKALIASAAGGIPEMIGAPKNGLLFEPGNALDLAQKLTELVQNAELRVQLGINARIRAEAVFDRTNYHREVLRHIREEINVLP